MFLHTCGIQKLIKKKKIAEKMHIEKAGELIKEILNNVVYNVESVQKVINIVQSHKSKNPENIKIACMVDADNLSDLYKKEFISNCKVHNTSMLQTYEFKSRNTYFTKSANKIAKKMLNIRLKEIQK